MFIVSLFSKEREKFNSFVFMSNAFDLGFLDFFMFIQCRQCYILAKKLIFLFSIFLLNSLKLTQGQYTNILSATFGFKMNFKTKIKIC